MMCFIPSERPCHQSLACEVNRLGSQGGSYPHAACFEGCDGVSHGGQQSRLLGLKEDAESACDLESEGLGDSTGFEVVEDDGIVRFIQRGLDDRSFTHVDLRCEQGMNRNAMGAVLDAMKGLDFLPSGIFRMTGGEFLADFPRHDDFTNQG